MGQSNIAAGATIGSNHNSRGADGEIIMGRGFWPGLCVSLKHNSRFASFAILSKGDYPSELDNAIPVSLSSNDVANDRLTIMPAYWFMYNMYALARNSWKYVDRDKRTQRVQLIEYDYLAPDTVNEIFNALALLEKETGNAYGRSVNSRLSEADATKTGHELLESGNRLVNELEITLDCAENSKRKVVVLKAMQSYRVFRELVIYYGITQLLQFISQNSFKTFEEVIAALPATGKRNDWQNIGGQLMPTVDVEKLKDKIRSGKIKTWDGVHDQYRQQSEKYPQQKLAHALAALSEITGTPVKKMTAHQFNSHLSSVIATREWMTKGMYDSRAKDYSNPFRKMVYENTEEMNAVVGKLEDNSFIKLQVE
jgi:hypothetical protein